MILAMIVSFNPMVAGGVRDLAGILRFGRDFDSAEMVGNIGLPMCLAAFSIYLAFEILSAVLFGYWGVKRRIKNREGMNLSDLEKKAEE